VYVPLRIRTVSPGIATLIPLRIVLNGAAVVPVALSLPFVATK
jgi:hypothetical protein